MVIQGIQWICSKVNKEEHLRTETGRNSSLLRTNRSTGSQYKHGEELSKNLISATSERVLITLRNRRAFIKRCAENYISAFTTEE